MSKMSTSRQICICKKKEFDRMLTEGIIHPSETPYASPLCLVPQPNGGDFRPCDDYHKLNTAAIFHCYPIPHIHNFTLGLNGSKILSKINLTKDYFQIPVADEDIHKVAVISPFRLNFYALHVD